MNSIMETKFNSQICTSVEQSRRLLALGLKKETADMYISNGVICARPYSEVMYFMEGLPMDEIIPSWSLSRLIEMMPRTIKANDDLFFLLVSKEDVFYDNTEGTAYSSFINRNGLYYNIILCIEWLITEGYFNEEYLNEHQVVVNEYGKLCSEIEEHCKGVMEYLDYIRKED